MNPTDIDTLKKEDVVNEYVICHNASTHVSNKISVKEIIDYVVQEATKQVVKKLEK